MYETLACGSNSLSWSMGGMSEEWLPADCGTHIDSATKLHHRVSEPYLFPPSKQGEQLSYYFVERMGDVI